MCIRDRSTLKPTRNVACVALMWKCFSNGTMATVKLEPLTFAMNEKRQMVAYVVTLDKADQFRGSLGSLLGIGSVSSDQYIAKSRGPI